MITEQMPAKAGIDFNSLNFSVIDQSDFGSNDKGKYLH